MQIGEKSLFQNRHRPLGVQFELNRNRLAVGGGHGTIAAHDPAKSIDIPAMLKNGGVIKEVEDSPHAAIAGESQLGSAGNLHRQHYPLPGCSRPAQGAELRGAAAEA